MDHGDRDETGGVSGTNAGDQIGLGRVVENRASIGSPDEDDTGGMQAPGAPVDEASEDSFPASDPPTFMSDAATPRDPDRVGLPRPDEAP